MVQISLEMFQGIALLAHFLGYAFMPVHQFAQCVWLDVCSGLYVQVFTEGEAFQAVASAYPVQFRVFVLQSHHRASGKHNL